MEKKTPNNLQHLKNKRGAIRVEADQIAKTSSKMKAAHLLGLASAIAGGTTPTETSVSRHFATRNAIAHAKHVSRATLNQPSHHRQVDGDDYFKSGYYAPSRRLHLKRKTKRKARMRLRARRGRWC